MTVAARNGPDDTARNGPDDTARNGPDDTARNGPDDTARNGPDNAARYFEDWSVGDTLVFGHYEVTAEEIKAFAEKFDPQPFHLDEGQAAGSLFGGLVASGWHSGAMLMRMVADNPAFVAHNIAASGFDDLVWHQPVRPGDRLSVRSRILDKRLSKSRPDRGIVTLRQELLNQAGETAMSFTSAVHYLRRPGRVEAGP